MLAFSGVATKAQSRALDSVYAQFKSTYEAFVISQPEENYLGAIFNSANTTLTADNDHFVEAVIHIMNSKKGITIKDACDLLTDSIITRFIRKDYWSETDRGYLGKYPAIFSYVNDNSCNCITPKSNGVNAYDQAFIKIVEACAAELMQDTSYARNIFRLSRDIPRNQLIEFGNVVSKYLHVNCPVLYKSFVSTIKNFSGDENVYRLDRIAFGLGEKALTLYQEKNQKQLDRIFPANASFKSQLAAAATFQSKGTYASIPENKKNSSGTITITRTYYNYDFDTDKVVLTSQLIYTVSSVDIKARILSLQFVTADKIQDKKRLTQLIRDQEILEIPPPPPPRIDMLEMKIDTLKKKN